MVEIRGSDVSGPVFDATSGRFYDDPWETYRWLRDHDPVHWDEANRLWVLSRYEDVSHVSRHPERYMEISNPDIYRKKTQ